VRRVRYRTERKVLRSGRGHTPSLARSQAARYFAQRVTRQKVCKEPRSPTAMDVALTLPHGPIWYGATVLVVDDEPGLRDVVRRMLEAEGFHVEKAPDGASALHLVQARAEPFDLVLTDLAMPESTGVRSRKRWHGIGRASLSSACLAIPTRCRISSRQTPPSGCC
jgi:PleD family two-component response regulator